MSQFWKFSSILAVLALLVVMGLSTQGTRAGADGRRAGAWAGNRRSQFSYVCSEAGGVDGLCHGTAADGTVDGGADPAPANTDNMFRIAVEGAADGTASYNLSPVRHDHLQPE